MNRKKQIYGIERVRLEMRISKVREIRKVKHVSRLRVPKTNLKYYFR